MINTPIHKHLAVIRTVCFILGVNMKILGLMALPVSVVLLSVSAHAQTMSGRGVDASAGGAGYGAQLALKDLQAQVSGNTNIITGNSSALNDQSARLDGIDSHLSTIDQRLDALETSLNNITTSLQTMTTTLNTITTTTQQNQSAGTACTSRRAVFSIPSGQAFSMGGGNNTKPEARMLFVPGVVDQDYTLAEQEYSSDYSAPDKFRFKFQCSNGQLIFRSATMVDKVPVIRGSNQTVYRSCVSNDGVHCTFGTNMTLLVN